MKLLTTDIINARKNTFKIDCLNDRVISRALAVEQFFSPKRGRIYAFSWRSSRRLDFLLHSYQVFPYKGFLTLTFRDIPDVDFAKKCLNRFVKFLNRRSVGWLWVMEFQARGAIHYHFLLTRFVKYLDLKTIWFYGRISVESIKNNERIKKYLSSLDKQDLSDIGIWGDDEMRGVILHEINKSNQKNAVGFNGRWWGVCSWLNIHEDCGALHISAYEAACRCNGFKKIFLKKDFLDAGVLLSPLEKKV